MCCVWLGYVRCWKICFVSEDKLLEDMDRLHASTSKKTHEIDMLQNLRNKYSNYKDDNRFDKPITSASTRNVSSVWSCSKKFHDSLNTKRA